MHRFLSIARLHTSRILCNTHSGHGRVKKPRSTTANASVGIEEMENIMHSQVDILEQDRSQESEMMQDVLKVHASELKEPVRNSGDQVDQDWYLNAAHNIPSKWADFVPKWKKSVKKMPEVAVSLNDPFLKVAAVVEEIKKENGANTVVMNMTSKCDYADAFIFTQGTNTRHVSAIAEAVRMLAKSKIKTDSTLPKSIQMTSGAKEQEWVIVDLGKYIVHVLTPEAREYYDLEGLWAFVIDPVTYIKVAEDKEAAALLAHGFVDGKDDAPLIFPNLPGAAWPTGCVLVDSRDNIIAMDRTGESHAIVRAILSSTMSPKGLDIYYFPARNEEVRYDLFSVRDTSPIRSNSFAANQRERNYQSVMRLVQNNSIALSLYVPQWKHPQLTLEEEEELIKSHPIEEDWGWFLDETVGNSPNVAGRWDEIRKKFQKTVLAVYLLNKKYQGGSRSYHDGIEIQNYNTPAIFRHAIVLAHIAAKRTDDPKIGVGSVLIDGTHRYISVGWNGYPKKAQHLDYPHAGADDSVADAELKYDYMLHAEQNTLLWRNPIGCTISPDYVLVSTKMPCDECSPVIYDCGIKSVVTVPQTPKAHDDPARLRGLTYEKISKLISNLHIFSQ